MIDRLASSMPGGPPRRTVFGKYHAVARIGRGGMGEVFLAVNVGPAGVSKLVVIKDLRPDVAETPDARTMFLDEARLATRFNHPNVVQTYEVVEDGDSLYLTMEYLDGQPLQRILRGADRARFPLRVLLPVVADALAGLHYAHELTDYDGTPLEVVHRDVSPQNIIVTYEGTTKLVDFGIAKAADASTVTESGVFKGKIRFSAPEQALCKPIDRRTDVFAMGMVLWEICTGEPMWRNMPDAAVLFELANGRIPKARVVNSEVPAELEAICAKALSVDPAARYPTADAMRLAILGYLRKSGDAEGGSLKEILASVFAEERTRIRAVIEAETRSVREASSRSRDVRRVIELSLRSSERTAQTMASAGISAYGSDAPTEGPPRKSRRALVSVAVGALALAGLAAYAATRESAPPAAKAASTAPQPVDSAPAAVVHLRVAAQPRSAQVSIDGTPAPSNPYEADVPRDGAFHHVTVAAPGFDTRTTDARFDHDLTIELALVPSATAVTPPTPAPPPVAPVYNRPPSGFGSPASGLGPRPRQRPIEEESPYSR
jgi:serine/threonine-protein kinase